MPPTASKMDTCHSRLVMTRVGKRPPIQMIDTISHRVVRTQDIDIRLAVYTETKNHHVNILHRVKQQLYIQ